MKLRSNITVVAAFLSAFLIFGSSCAQKSSSAALPDTGETEVVASTVPFSSVPEGGAVEETAPVETVLLADPAVAVEAKEEPVAVAAAVVVETQVAVPEEKVELTAQAEKPAKGKTIELEKFAPQTGLSFTFNRLLKRKLSQNLPPVEDGIHDPENSASILLQTPKEGMKGFVKSRFGNRVDWVKTLNQNIINPRASLEDPTEEMEILELNVVRVPVGSMPKVVYPHDRHTAWLACENCHEDIFIMEAGANEISMEMIIRGEKCGVCHGKVAFPISQCKKCHSLRKTEEEKAAQGIK